MKRETIKKAIYNYSAYHGYGDDLRGALISAVQILNLDLLEAFKEIDFILRYESDKPREYLKVLKELGK